MNSMRREKIRHLDILSAAGLRKVTIRPSGKNNHARSALLTCRKSTQPRSACSRARRFLITGATGKIAFPLLGRWRSRTRFGVPRASASLQTGTNSVQRQFIHFDSTCRAANSRNCLTTFTYVFHAAVDTGAGDWRRCVQTNAHNSGRLLYHCRRALGFVYCSTGSIYQFQGQRPLTEADGPGCHYGRNYSFSKVAGEAVCGGLRPVPDSTHHHSHLLDLWTGGWHAASIGSSSCCRESPSGCTPMSPITTTRSMKTITSSWAPAMEVAAVPAVVVNWAGSELSAWRTIALHG